MIEERFADAERQLLIMLVTRALVSIQLDPEMDAQTEECRTILRRLSGTDTVLVARRAYASTASSRSGTTRNTTCNS